MATLDFESDLKQLINEDVILMGLNALDNTDFSTMLTQYIHLHQLRLPNIKWNVKKSTSLERKNLSEKIYAGLEQFIKKAEGGENLRPYLSTRVNNPDFKDLMFADWRIFHFHLGIAPDPNNTNFMERTNELLFAITEPEHSTMYLIDILPHGAWTEQNLLRIIETNWPKILEQFSLKGVKDAGISYSNEDRLKFHKAHINVCSQLSSGDVLMPLGGGYTTDGTSVLDKMLADHVRMKIYNSQKWIIHNKGAIEKRFINSHGKSWDALEFKIVSLDSIFAQDNRIKVQEVTTGEVIEIPSNYPAF